MPLVITHAFVSEKGDGLDTTRVQPSNWNDDHVITGTGLLPIGCSLDFDGHTTPTYFLEKYGQSVSSVTYALLYAELVKTATVTITIATPGVVSWASHGRRAGDKIQFRTTGALPTGLVANTDYYVISAGLAGGSFRLALTPEGTEINTTGSQSGVQTGVHAPAGVAADLSTFVIPDDRGRVTVGADNMGGTAAVRLTGVAGSVNGTVMGAAGGAETHALVEAENGPHTHSLTGTAASNGAHTHTVSGTAASDGAHTHTVSGTAASDGAHTHTVSGTAASDGAHTHTMAHTHTFSDSFSGTTGSTSVTVDYDADGNYAGGGSKTGVRAIDSSYLFHGATDSHTHSFSGSVSGTTGGSSAANTGSSGTHTHTVSGTAASNGAHTHTVSGTADSGGAHTHVVSGTAASDGAHTHTVSGTAASSGLGTAHNNVQPSRITRKIIFAGV